MVYLALLPGYEADGEEHDGPQHREQGEEHTLGQGLAKDKQEQQLLILSIFLTTN